MDKEYNLIVKLFNGTIKEKIIILKEIEEELKKISMGRSARS